MIPITKPLMGDAEAEAARRVILSGWTSQGPEVAAFAARICRFGRLTARMCGVQLHDNSLRYYGATPVSRAKRMCEVGRYSLRHKLYQREGQVT